MNENTNFVSLAHEVIRPSYPSIGCIEEVCPSHPMSGEEDQRKGLRNLEGNEMLDIHLTRDDGEALEL